MKNLLAGLGFLFGVGLLLAAQDERPDDQAALVKALERLAAAQERQATAWEKATERELPAPQVYQLTGGVPSTLRVELGQVPVSLSGVVELDGDIGVGQRQSIPWTVND